MKKHYITLVFAVVSSCIMAQSPCPSYKYTSYPPRTHVNEECTDIKPCGIFIIKNAKYPDLNYQTVDQYYDGIFIKIPWNLLQPSGAGPFPFAWFNQHVISIIDFADQRGKQVSIAVMAGEDTPDWVIANMTNNFPCVQNITQFGVIANNAKCEGLANVPAPWDHTFKQNYKGMISELGF